jgi:N-acetylmuramoyl-L-alanine amidase
MASDGPRMSDLVECKGNKRDAENMALATATHAAMVGRSRLFDRGIKRARFVVIRDIGIPGVLIEGGFLSNSHDAKLIASAQYRQLMAFSIAMAVNNYQRATTANPPPFLAKAPQVQLRDESGAEIQPPASGGESEPSPTPEASPEPTPEPTLEPEAPAAIPPPESTTEQPTPDETPKPEA